MMLTRLYRLALYLLPTALHRKHGPAMEALFARDVAHARANGWLQGAWAGALGIGDVVLRSVYELVRMKIISQDIQMGVPDMPLPTTRQLLGRLALSFTIAFVGLTAFMLFVFLRKQPALFASGVSAGTITEALLLALPFTAAMTIPMAVLLSVLHEFSRLGSNGTLTAARRMRDGVRRLVVPVLVASVGITTVAFVVTAEIVPRTNARLASALAGVPTARGDRSMTISELRDAARAAGAPAPGARAAGAPAPGARAAGASEPAVLSRAASYEVEVQKKLALPAACLLLAIAGMALAFRVPRGGPVFVIAASVVCFGAYYGLIITGETLADQLIVSPIVGMWGANAFVLTVALLALWQRRGAIATSGPEAVVMRG